VIIRFGNHTAKQKTGEKTSLLKQGLKVVLTPAKSMRNKIGKNLSYPDKKVITFSLNSAGRSTETA